MLSAAGSYRPLTHRAGQEQPKRYIVRREIADNGPYGSEFGYVSTTSPKDGETVYHGKFKRVEYNCGQYDAQTCVRYEPVGEISEEIYGTETF